MTAEEYAKTYLENEIKIIENSHRNDILPELTVFEKAIVYKYTEDGYESLNETLRKKRFLEVSEFGRLFAECLDKLPNFRGNVFRSVDLTTIEWEKYKTAFENNEEITEHFFISTSKVFNMGYAFGKIRFKIYTFKGKNIEYIAKHSDEKEVVLQFNSSFRVIAIDNNIIQLIEV